MVPRLHLRPWVVSCIAAAVLATTWPAQAQVAAPSRNLAPGFAGLAVADKVLLMPVDIELFQLGSAGITEPMAAWTAAARGHVRSAIEERRAQWRVSTVELGEAAADDHAEQMALHAAVAKAILVHHFGAEADRLPTKGGRLDWSFGNDALRPLRDRTGARYALFTWVRDSYTSKSRVATQIVWAALGVLVPGGVQLGYASLVDLDSGRVVWFNRLARVKGDLREAAPARESVDALLEGFPMAP